MKIDLVHFHVGKMSFLLVDKAKLALLEMEQKVGGRGGGMSLLINDSVSPPAIGAKTQDFVI